MPWTKPPAPFRPSVPGDIVIVVLAAAFAWLASSSSEARARSAHKVATGDAIAASTGRYVNAKYGVSFAIPADAGVCRSQPPQPDHGLLFRPAGVISPPCDDDIGDGARYTSADAHFHVDSEVTTANFVRTECPRMAYDSQGRVTGIAPPARPGGLPWAACRVDGANGAVFEILFGQRGPGRGVPAIDYTLVLRTTLQDYPADHATFRRWLATVRLGTPR